MCAKRTFAVLAPLTVTPRSDTSQLYEEVGIDYPLEVTQLPNLWEGDIRRKLFEFFRGVICPEMLTPAQQGALATMVERKPQTVVEFEYYEDGNPILYRRDKNGKLLKGPALRDVFRAYMQHHWGTPTITALAIQPDM